MCHVCPLNHMRKVGFDGPVGADYVLIGEAPGKTETGYNINRERYGRPFVGRSGWTLRVKLLGLAEYKGRRLVELTTDAYGNKAVAKLNVFIMNTIMCEPPKDKIDSPQGRRAVACCRNSAVRMLKELQALNPNMAVGQLGSTALELTTGRTGIDKHRGTVLPINVDSLEEWTEERRLKIALRGVKPWVQRPDVVTEEQWKLFEKVLKGLMTWHRRQLRAALKPRKVKLAELPAECISVIRVLQALVRKQRAAVSRTCDGQEGVA